MKFRYRGKEYDSEEPLPVLDMRDLGAYVIMRYPSVPQNRFLMDRGFDGLICMYLYTYDNKLTRDTVIHLLPKQMMTEPEVFRAIEKRIEKILLKRGFI